MDSDTSDAPWHPAEPSTSANDERFEAGPQSEPDNSSDHQTQPSGATEEDASEDTTVNAASDQPGPDEQPSKQPSGQLLAELPSHAASSAHLEHDEQASGASIAGADASTGRPPRADDGAPNPNDEVAVTAAPDPGPADRPSKHLSTLSFTRTVSHEVSFNDDEDAEWSLQVSEASPFSFMPPNDRTNSFPVVSPTSSTAGQFSRPPPSTGTEEILHTSETENTPASATDFASNVADLSRGNPSDKQEEEGTPFHHTMGGDFVDPAGKTFDVRFEQGLPLISQRDAPETTTENVESKGADPTAIFAHDESDNPGEDFFAQIQTDPQTPTNPRTLQTKSTSMVMGQDIDPVLASPAEDVALKVQSISSPSINADLVRSPEGGTKATEDATDLDAKWAAAFADGDDDDGFLLDAATESKELDPADIFGSDDEGFLDDDDEEPTPAALSQAPTPQPILNGLFAPGPAQQPLPSAANPYGPASTVAHMPVPQQYPQHPPNAAPVRKGYGAPPPKPDPPKAQSFVDKSKGGYQSPYDLPMEVIKPPRKRASAPQLPRVGATAPTPPSVPPPGNETAYAQSPLLGGLASNLSSLGPNRSNQQPSVASQKSTPQSNLKPSFFEDLPLTSKPRSSSRQSIHPSLTQQNSYGQPRAVSQGSPMSTPSLLSPPQPAQQLPPPQAAGLPALVAPERVSPYASLQADGPSKPQISSTMGSRYSPTPTHPPGTNGPVPAAAPSNRYSPAPPNSRSSSGSYSAVPPPMLAHQPRTSSPLAQFEVSHRLTENKHTSSVNGDGISLMRTSSSQYEYRATRVPSLPPTQEVEEELLPDSSSNMAAKTFGTASPPPAYSPTRARQTPPPSMRTAPSNPLSPSKRSLSNYTPQSVTQTSPKENNFVPPPRSQTQSPGTSYGRRLAKPMDSAPRPSSAHAPTPQQPTPSTQTSHIGLRNRSMSQHLDLVPPTDGREFDPLQRWRGAPCIAWGVGGLFVSTYPKDVPRYGIGSNVPQIIRSPGEVKVKHMKDIQPLEDRLSKFPGPLKGKSKKKEVIAWLNTGITGLEMTLPNVTFQQRISHEDNRAIERVLLWKILRVLVENDGVLEGNPTVETAVRCVISPSLAATIPESSPPITTGSDLTGMAGAVAAMQADSIDSTVTESIRMHLLLGDREKAVWAAVDKRLWGHAILLSSSMPNPELYRQVAQEFIKKEVNHAGHGNESLAALYSVLSGNFEETVDELVPAHARAGLQLMSTSAPTESQDILSGLDKWRETLGLILSNRRQGDGQALRALGNLLSGYGRAEAAHICYIFARQFAVFGGLDDPNANFVLVGADHRRQADQFAKETEALQLSEVYEYGLSLAPSSVAPQSCPHLAGYKLQHATFLAEYGFRDKALQYCEAIWAAITSQTKKSPYFNPVLESAIDDVMRRLKQAAGDESSSWITKPKMDQVSSNMWSRFSKFVAGPDEDGAGNGTSGEVGAEVGPFARIAGGTPAISRSPSVSNFEAYGTSPPTMPLSRAFSAYAPVAAQPAASPYETTGAYSSTPRSSIERTSGELRRSSSDFVRRGLDMQSAHANPYAPLSTSGSSPTSAYQPMASSDPEALLYTAASQNLPPASITERSSEYSGHQSISGDQVARDPDSTPAYSVPEITPQDQASKGGADFNPDYQPSYGGYGGYAPFSTNSFEPPATQAESPADGYEPPSYQSPGFEPPSYDPGPMDNDESEYKPRMKSFMDDDDDDIPGLKPKEKSKTEKDRENEEMFRKVAEEEAKRAAEAKSTKKSGWGFGGWFGGGGGGGSSSSGGKKDTAELPNKPIKAKLGEASSFVYDPDLKRWVNKKPGAENTPSKTATPPPPRAASTPPSTTSAPPFGNMAPPPPRPTQPAPGLNKAMSQENLISPSGPPLMARTVSGQSNASTVGGPPSAPPSRPTTSLSNASSIDDLLGAAGPRKGAKKPRKSGRYVDVMAK
ncbi:Sec23-binding domain of Sec16-domain-containing protein [Xylaria sp. CBS 124048]|nr:Sec23-binding domain of Sec16-domain-containing protein [Xylaria sp. CBS 124048]